MCESIPYLHSALSHRLYSHLTEYNWPVFSGMSRPTTVLVVFFGCDKQCASVCCFRRLSIVPDPSTPIQTFCLIQLFSLVMFSKSLGPFKVIYCVP